MALALGSRIPSTVVHYAFVSILLLTLLEIVQRSNFAISTSRITPLRFMLPFVVILLASLSILPLTHFRTTEARKGPGMNGTASGESASPIADLGYGL